MSALRLPRDRILHLANQVNQETILALTKEIILIEEDDKYLKGLYFLHGLKYSANPIKIFIDSYGGMLYQCMGLLGVMDKCQTSIHTIVTGCAMSCGFLITIAGHKRFAYETSTLMYHQISSGIIGKAKDIEEEVIEVRRLQSWLERYTMNKTSIGCEKLEEVYSTKHDWYMTSQEALELGVINEII